MALPSLPTEVLLLVIGYFVSGLLSLGVAVYALRRRQENPTVGSFGILLVATSLWSLGFMTRVLSQSVELKLLWLLVGYVGLVAFPTTLLVFSLYYSGKPGWVTQRTVALLAIVPAFLVVAMATNSFHGFFFTNPSLSSETGWPLLALKSGPLFWLNIVYNYLIYVSALSLLAGYALKARGRFRWQATLVLIAFSFLFLVNAGFVFGLEPFPEADPTPIAIGVCASILTFAIARADFVDIVPVAREQVFESVEDGVVTVDSGGRVVDVNARAERILGLDADAVIGESVEDALPEAVVETEMLEDEGKGENERQTEVRLGDDGEAERWLWVRRFPLSENEGGEEGAGWILILTDITRRKKREEQLARQNERLDRIAGVVSHDLRNPMDVIKKRETLARETGAEEDFDAIERSVERMDELLDDMLQLARQGRDIDERETVELDSIAESAWHTVDTDRAKLISDSDLLVSADKSRLRQAFENLFRNSIEHGGDTVTVRVGRLGEREGFYVEDDGPGIPPEERDEVFEYGWTDSESGNGFGLSIVRDVIEAHGWSVRVTEGDNGGARFEVFDVEPITAEDRVQEYRK